MFLSLYKVSGIPLARDLYTVEDLPHTLTQAIMYRAKIDSLNELPKDKRPPRNLWDKPYALDDFIDHVWDSDEDRARGKKDYYEFDLEDVE